MVAGLSFIWVAKSGGAIHSARVKADNVAVTDKPPTTTAVRVLVWDERQAEQHVGYGDSFLGETLARGLSAYDGLEVENAFFDEAEQGLSEERLRAAQVLVWWSHRRNDELSDAVVQRIKQRVLSGQLALIALHSAHWSKPFVELMQERAKFDARESLPEGERDKVSWVYYNDQPYRKLLTPDAPFTPQLRREGNVCHLTLPACVFPFYKADGLPSEVEVTAPEHPIAAGLPAKWQFPHTEMYGNPFHVPTPDVVIFREKWQSGHEFDSGCLWRLESGWVFYFGPGHETYGIYQQELPVRVIAQAAKWLATQHERRE